MRRAAAVAVVLAIGAAIWEIDPRWILESDPTLDVIGQTEANQAAGYGSQVIAWVGVPWAVLSLILALGLPRRTPAAHRLDLLGLWVVWSLVGALAGPDLIRGFAYTIATACTVEAARRLGRLTPRLLAFSIAGSLAVYLAISGVVKFGGIATITIYGQRLTLLSLEANQLGRMASLAGFAAAYLLTHPVPGQWRWVDRVYAGGTMVVAGSVLLLTGSRTGLAATVLAGLVFLVAARNRVAWALALAGALVGLGALVYTDTGRGVIDDVFRDTSVSRDDLGTLTGRTQLWPMVTRAIEERVVTGHGLGNDTAVLSPRSPEVGFVVEHTHNFALHLLLVTGVVGALFLVAAMLRAAGEASETTRPWVWALIAYFAVAGISEAVLRNPDVSLLAIVFLVVLAEPNPSTTPRSVPTEYRDTARL